VAGFRKLKSGKWQARVFKDGKEFSVGTFRTKKEAEIEAGKIEERLYYGQTLTDKNMLCCDVIEKWLKEKKANVKKQTFSNLIGIANMHILPFFGNKRMIRISRQDIKTWLETYSHAKKGTKQQHAYGTRLKHLTYLKSIFHFAVHELEILDKNPADRLKVPMQDTIKTKKKIKYFTLNELNTLLDFLKTYKHSTFEEYRIYYMLLYFLSQTGLRISEALALRWSDIVGNKITIERQTIQNRKNNVELSTLKNSSSYRTIGLNAQLLHELKTFKRIQNEMILKHEQFQKNKDSIIFQNDSGNYLIPVSIRETLKKYCRQAGIPYKGTHVFRHTHAVLLLESGASIKFVSQRLGHKTISTTADTYLDITQKIEEDELKKFASYTQR